MGIDIVHLQHGEPQLWLWLGPFLCDRKVHKALDGPIYSNSKTEWWIATKDGRVVGFCSLRDEPSSYWQDYVYTVEDQRHMGIHAKLAEAREAHLITLPPKPIQVCCRQRRWHHYEKRGFIVKSQRGDWIYGVRE